MNFHRYNFPHEPPRFYKDIKLVGLTLARFVFFIAFLFIVLIYQAIGIFCFKEVYPPKLKTLVSYTDGACRADEVRDAERIMLKVS